MVDVRVDERRVLQRRQQRPVALFVVQAAKEITLQSIRVTRLGELFFVALAFRSNPSIKMGRTDRCGILFCAGSSTTDRLLVASSPQLFPTSYFLQDLFKIN
jgi:hypothetical protein